MRVTQLAQVLALAASAATSAGDASPSARGEEHGDTDRHTIKFPGHNGHIEHITFPDNFSMSDLPSFLSLQECPIGEQHNAEPSAFCQVGCRPRLSKVHARQPADGDTPANALPPCCRHLPAVGHLFSLPEPHASEGANNPRNVPGRVLSRFFVRSLAVVPRSSRRSQQLSARLSFCCRPLHIHIEAPTKRRGGCSRMTISPTARPRLPRLRRRALPPRYGQLLGRVPVPGLAALVRRVPYNTHGPDPSGQQVQKRSFTNRSFRRLSLWFRHLLNQGRFSALRSCAYVAEKVCPGVGRTGGGKNGLCADCVHLHSSMLSQAGLAVGESSAILLQPALPLVGVSVGMERESVSKMIDSRPRPGGLLRGPRESQRHDVA